MVCNVGDVTISVVVGVLLRILAGGVAAAVGSVAIAPAVEPARAASNVALAAGSVRGTVAVPGGQRLPEMVVYLESTDPNYSFKADPKPVMISQKGAKFNPGLLVVPVGSRVDFQNDEPKEIQHNVFSNSEAKKFDLGLYKPGDAVQPVTFDTPGSVRLRCSIHRYMDGVIYVTPTPFYAVVGKDGSFSIANVKPGRYTLKTWQRSQRYKEQELSLTINAGQPSTINVGMSR